MKYPCPLLTPSSFNLLSSLTFSMPSAMISQSISLEKVHSADANALRFLSLWMSLVRLKSI